MLRKNSKRKLLTEEHKRKIGLANSVALKGKKLSEEVKRKISEKLRGRKLTEAHKKHLSEALKDKLKSEEHKRKLSEALRGKPRLWNKGEKCHFWRGGMMEKISAKCTVCGKINLVRKGWFMKRVSPYKCRNCGNKGKKRTLEYRLKSSLVHRKYNLDESFFEKEINFRSLKMTQDLARYFVTSRKTYTVKFPIIPKSFERHFIRGVFDADGCVNKTIRITRGKSGQIYICYGGEFGIEGNKEFVLAIQNRLAELGLSRNSLNYPGKRINRVRYGGINQLRKIYNYLYEGATFFLERKKKLFEEILKNYHHEIIRQRRKEFKLPKLELVK